MKYLRKMAASAVTLIMVMSSIFASSCSPKNKKAGEVISADSVWYNMTKTVLDYGFDPDGIEYFYPMPLGQMGDYIAVRSNGFLKTFTGDYTGGRLLDYVSDYVDVYDTNGNLVNTIDMVDLISNSALIDDYIGIMREAESGREDMASEGEPAEESEDAIESEEEEAETEEAEQSADSEEDISESERSHALSSFNFGGVNVMGDRLVTVVSFEGPTYNTRIDYTVRIDPVTSDITFELRDNANRVQGVYEGIVDLGEYNVEMYYTFSMNSPDSSYILNIYNNTELYRVVDLSSRLPGESIGNIDAVLRMDDDTMLVKFQRNVGPKAFFTLDIPTGNVRLAEEGEYDWLNNYNLFNCVYIEGSGSVILDDEGIKSFDYENKTVTEVFSFDSCNVNRGDIEGLRLMSYSEDKIVFVGALFRGSMFHSLANPPILITLTRAETNPNAGKTVITAASVGRIGYGISEAVCIFNETDPDYFIRFDNRYKADKHVDNATTDYSDTADYQRAYEEATIELSNQLAIDLMAGDGPDIIFDASSLSQLNNSNYLLDMSDRISTDDLFSNVIDAAKIGGKLYQIPLTFGITGIAVLNEDISAGQTGFTFEQYEDLVRTVCNGKDPLSMDQTEFFITCMEAMNEQFYTDDGRITYDNEAFRSLAQYTNDYVTAPIVIPEIETIFAEIGEGDPLLENGAIYISSGSFDGFLARLGNHSESSAIMGLPSVDGRGPEVTVSTSVAISAQTDEPDACYNFVETLLSPDIQQYCAQDSGGSPVCVSAYEAFARDVIDDYNDSVEDVSSMSTEAMALYGTHITEIDYSFVDIYEQMIRSVISVSSTDNAITVIVREEMPAFFSGQKTLDEVISIMEDRVQTFLDERR